MDGKVICHLNQVVVLIVANALLTFGSDKHFQVHSAAPTFSHTFKHASFEKPAKNAHCVILYPGSTSVPPKTTSPTNQETLFCLNPSINDIP
jgi:hypothetical protein